MSKLSNQAVGDQVAGVFVAATNTLREEALASELHKQDLAMDLALEQIEKVKEFVEQPNAILGSTLTKHGEIAEQVEVGVRNAREALSGVTPDKFGTTFEGVGRTAPEDFLLDGLAVQSKFINGLNNNLSHVLEHMEKYPDFGRDGSYYQIPKDAHKEIMDILAGDNPNGYSQATLNAIREKAASIEELSGTNFNEVVQPSVSNYSDVQLGKIDETLSNRESEIRDANENIKDGLKADSGPSLSEAGNVALAGGVIGGAISFGTGVYQKYKDGKNLFKGDFTSEDWKELGLDTGKGIAVGAVSSLAIYGLTNFADLGAPFAAAVVSATKGVAVLTSEYRSGEISFDEFVDLSLVACSESALVGICTAAGQALIPIPIVGALVGSIAGRILIGVAEGMGDKLTTALNESMQEFCAELDAVSKAAIDEIKAKFDALGKLTDAAFDFNNNLALASIELAREHGVRDSEIIKNHNELDDFMLG
ncbi:hypothetical protein ACP3VZ_01645 [Vibrio sp. PNB22_2_2]